MEPTSFWIVAHFALEWKGTLLASWLRSHTLKSALRNGTKTLKKEKKTDLSCPREVEKEEKGNFLSPQNKISTS